MWFINILAQWEDDIVGRVCDDDIQGRLNQASVVITAPVAIIGGVRGTSDKSRDVFQFYGPH